MKRFTLVFLISLFLFFLTDTAPASESSSEKPVGTTGTSAETIVAQMSDEHAGTFGEFIKGVKNKMVLIQGRIAYIRSGGKSNRQEMKGFFAYLEKGDSDSLPIHSIFLVLILFAAAFAIELLYHFYSTAFRRRIQTGTPVNLPDKIGRQFLRVFIDVIAILIFIIAVFVCRCLRFRCRR